MAYHPESCERVMPHKTTESSYEEHLSFYKKFFTKLAELEVEECITLGNDVAKHHRQIRRDKATRLELNTCHDNY